MKDDDIIQFYRIEYNKEYREAVKAGIVPSANALRERFGLGITSKSSWLNSIFG